MGVATHYHINSEERKSNLLVIVDTLVAGRLQCTQKVIVQEVK